MNGLMFFSRLGMKVQAIAVLQQKATDQSLGASCSFGFLALQVCSRQLDTHAGTGAKNRWQGSGTLLQKLLMFCIRNRRQQMDR